MQPPLLATECWNANCSMSCTLIGLHGLHDCAHIALYWALLCCCPVGCPCWAFLCVIGVQRKCNWVCCRSVVSFVCIIYIITDIWGHRETKTHINLLDSADSADSTEGQRRQHRQRRLQVWNSGSVA